MPPRRAPPARAVAAAVLASLVLVGAIVTLLVDQDGHRIFGVPKTPSTATGEADPAAPEGSAARESGGAAAATGVGAVPAAPSKQVLPDAPGRCPDPATCVRFAFFNGATASSAPRWPVRDGTATIRYQINTTGAVTTLSQQQILEAIRSSFATWRSAVPAFRFVFDGFTTRLATQGDGFNVIDFAQLSAPKELGLAKVTARGDRIVEADMSLVALTTATGAQAVAVSGWGWDPCTQQNGSCSDTRDCDVQVPVPVGVRVCAKDIQNIVTHEIGHWLWLADLADASSKSQTMYERAKTGTADSPITERIKVTLGLGDVVGARTLYPCDCALPSVYTP